MINWAYFPQSEATPAIGVTLIELFQSRADDIDSATHDGQHSNEVLAKLSADLANLGFKVERGKRKSEKINVPVLFGRNGKIEKSFEADAFLESGRFVLEIEAGRAVVNFQFLKDLFQACMMQGVDYLGIAVRNTYKNSHDFERVFTFLDTLYKSNRLRLPLKGILIIGY